MKKLKAAILHHPSSIREAETGAAIAGLKEFERFGLSCQLIDVSRESVKTVMRGPVLKDAIYSREFSIHPFDLFHSTAFEVLRSLFWEVDVRGIAITESVLFAGGEGREGQRGAGRSMGVSANGIGGIVSVSRLREICYRGQMPDAVRLAVMHEFGHVLGRNDHCANENCLMQENKDAVDFVSRFVERNLGMCRDCLDRVACGVSKLADGLG